MSVLQPWVEALPLREQGTLLSAVRGADTEPKAWDDSTGYVVDTQARRIVAWIRWCTLVPADHREVDVIGAFMQSHPPFPFRPSGFAHMPLHWYSHVMHALEVIAYRHPARDECERARIMYLAMVDTLHLRPEGRLDMIARLSVDRIATDTVVS